MQWTGLRSRLLAANAYAYRVRPISTGVRLNALKSDINQKRQKIKASLQKYEAKRKEREEQKQLELIAKTNVQHDQGKAYRSSVERSLFSLLFSNEIDYKVYTSEKDYDSPYNHNVKEFAHFTVLSIGKAATNG